MLALAIKGEGVLPQLSVLKASNNSIGDVGVAALAAAPPNAYDRLLDYAALRAVAVVTDTDLTNTTIGVESLDSDFKMMLYSVFASLAATVVFAHRLFPDACKRADLLFAGDHFIDDSVRP